MLKFKHDSLSRLVRPIDSLLEFISAPSFHLLVLLQFLSNVGFTSACNFLFKFLISSLGFRFSLLLRLLLYLNLFGRALGFRLGSGLLDHGLKPGQFGGEVPSHIHNCFILFFELTHLFLESFDLQFVLFDLLEGLPALGFDSLAFCLDLLRWLLPGVLTIGNFFDKARVFLDQLDYKHEVLVSFFHFFDLSSLINGTLLPLIHLFSDLLDLLG